ncbi:MAG: hypothetical protein U0W40_19175 [Acidimicrobiia bacterium]
MWWGIGTFFFVAILCIVAGFAVMKKRRNYEEGEGYDDGGMSDAEFRRIEGFDD